MGTREFTSGAIVLPEVPVILAVEDEELLRAFVYDALKDGAFDIVTCPSANDALTLFQSGVVKYSALVTDIDLKGRMGGWDLARRIREIDAAFPVVYMTGASTDEWGSQGVPHSILLQKPFAPAQLVTAISQLLNTGSQST
jgi:DNA-binding response OmpR family regulator